MKPLKDMSDDEIAELNRKNFEQNAKDFKDFKADLEQGVCWVCKDRLDSFAPDKPCQHWLLLPNGFRKKYFKVLFANRTFDKLEGFLRWYVNAHAPIRHINDLKEEHDSKLIRGVTIKHNDIEWSFYFGKSCAAGEDGNVGPHYHLQVKVAGKVLHGFSDRHIKLSDYELWQLDIDAGKNPKIIRREVQGAGIQDLLDNVEPENLLKGMRSTDDYNNAPFHISSMVIADEGHQISGDDIADIMEEHKKTGVPMHQLISRLKNVKTTVMVEPGPGIPEAFKRQKHRGAKKSQNK